MKSLPALRPRALRWFVLLLAAGTVSAADPREGLETREQEIRRKITELFEYRDDPPNQLAVEQNPFFREKPQAEVDESTTSVITDKDELEDPSLSPDERVLRQLIKTIHVNGVVTLADKEYIVINQTPIPIGGIAVVEYDGVSRLLRVESINTGEVTLSHGTARTIFVY